MSKKVQVLWQTKYFRPFCHTQSPTYICDIFKDNVRRNFTIIYTNEKSRRVDVDLGRYSSRCRYHKIHHKYYVHSCYRIVNRGKTLKISYDKNLQKNGREQYNINLQVENWTFKEDKYGVFITDGKADYHLSKIDIISFCFKKCVAEAIKNYARRIELELAEKFISYNAENIKVTMQDSLNAGNCEAGTIGFCKQYFDFIPQKEDYISGISAKIILETGNLAAKRAVLVAARRQMLETI